MFAITVLYPWGDFDLDYYRGPHLDLLKRHQAKLGYTDFSYTVYDVGPDGVTPPYRVIAQLLFADPATLASAPGSPEGQAVIADIANFFPGAPVMLGGAVSRLA